jgi:hypothetical protein
VDGREGVKGECPRCGQLAEIYETALKLNALIREFDPRFDDLRRRKGAKPHSEDTQMNLLDAFDEKSAPVQ